jgi:hypothetical protein
MDDHRVPTCSHPRHCAVVKPGNETAPNWPRELHSAGYLADRDVVRGGFLTATGEPIK